MKGTTDTSNKRRLVVGVVRLHPGRRQFQY